MITQELWELRLKVINNDHMTGKEVLRYMQTMRDDYEFKDEHMNT